MENKQHFTSLQPKTSLQDCKQQITTTTVNSGGVKEDSPQSVKGGRIEYIDALRGFTMILVVMTHVCNFCFQSYNLSYSSIMAQFRMPLFFFVSGFVFYKDIIWDRFTFVSFMKKKIPVQILTPTIFLLLYVYIKDLPIIGVVANSFRYGYWFTYTLFLYFLFYIFVKIISRRLRFNNIVCRIILLLWGIICYITVPIWGIPVEQDVAMLLLMPHWCYFLFFVIGVLVKEHFSYFQTLLDNRYFTLSLIILYFLYNIFREYIIGIVDVGVGCMCRFCGVFIVFAFFRKYSSAFTKEKLLGRSLQYVGRRTLDIYLLHYFFLPVGLASVFTFFADNELPSLEIFVSLFVALLIICLCLIISNVYRLSPWIEQYMFGVKKKKGT